MVNWKVFFTGFLVLFIDRITKNIFFEDSVRNYGAAFSLLQGLNVLFIIVAIAVICLIIYYSNKIRNVNIQIAMGFVLGGALSNMIDRVIYGGVIDFIKIWMMPVFNLADVFNVIGGLTIIYYLWRK